MMSISAVVCGGKPHGFWCAPLAPKYAFMITSCRMNVAVNKWLQRHLLLSILRQANDALCWFHVWNYISPPCSHKFMLPCLAGGTLFRGSIVLKEENKLKMPIGSMILPTLHVYVSGGAMASP